MNLIGHVTSGTASLKRREFAQETADETSSRDIAIFYFGFNQRFLEPAAPQLVTSWTIQCFCRICAISSTNLIRIRRARVGRVGSARSVSRSYSLLIRFLTS